MNSQTGLNSNQNRIRQNGEPVLSREGGFGGIISSDSVPRLKPEETDVRLADLIGELEPTVEDWSQIAILSPPYRRTSSSGIGSLIDHWRRGFPSTTPEGRACRSRRSNGAFRHNEPCSGRGGFYHDCLNQTHIKTPGLGRGCQVNRNRTDGSNEQVRKCDTTGNAISGSENGPSYYLLDVMFHILT